MDETEVVRTTCKREGCPNPPAPMQVYCSRDCAPYGWFGIKSHNTSTRPKEGWDPLLVEKAKGLARTGFARKEAAAWLGISYAAVCVLSRDCQIMFRPVRPGERRARNRKNRKR